MKQFISALSALSMVLVFSASAAAHCQLPCGIYDDEARLAEVSEDVMTIDKAVAQITALQKEKNINYNQLVRWIDNKEQHADKIQDIVSQYFLTQRIKFDAVDYDKKLAALHRILVYAMKCKQTVDPAVVDELRKACREFEKLYRAKH